MVAHPPAHVETIGLRVAFGTVVAVHSLDLTVQPASAVALVGRNGAGKSTTLRVLAGVLPATSGQVMVAGVDVTRDPATAKAHVGYCPDVGGLIPRATPWEHLALAAKLRGLGPEWKDRASELLDLFDLVGAADRITAGFSHGMGRRLSVVLAVLAPTGGVAPRRAIRRRRPTRRRRDLEVIAAGARQRVGRGRVDAPARARGSGVRRGCGAASGPDRRSRPVGRTAR